MPIYGSELKAAVWLIIVYNVTSGTHTFPTVTVSVPRRSVSTYSSSLMTGFTPPPVANAIVVVKSLGSYVELSERTNLSGCAHDVHSSLMNSSDEEPEPEPRKRKRKKEKDPLQTGRRKKGRNEVEAEPAFFADL